MNLETMSTEALEAQFNPRVAVPDAETFLVDYAARAAAARERLDGHLDIAYGDSPLQALDVFPAGRDRPPLHVFIHGGYWRALDKSDHSFLAEPLVTAGATAVLLNYDLCPVVTVDDIVRQVRAGIAWIYRNAAALGGDGERLFVSGHSAGAHLAVMALAHDWPTAEGLPADIIKGVFAVSGIYDLAPVLRISVNEEIRLDREMTRRNSPTLRPPGPGAALTLAVGANETPAWIDQSLGLRDVCREGGRDCEVLVVEGRNHFSILYDLADAETPLCRALLRQMKPA